jgi:hypothetical protein
MIYSTWLVTWQWGRIVQFMSLGNFMTGVRVGRYQQSSLGKLYQPRVQFCPKDINSVHEGDDFMFSDQ